jgi:CheY-like chemotaxis protein
MTSLATARPASAAGITFLVADDDPTNRLVLEGILSQSGHRVIEAANGAEAVERFQTQRPDAVLMDVMMPVMDGYEAARQIKSVAGEHFVPMLFLTALHDERALMRCVEAGGEDFLTKPFSRLILQSKIEALLRTRGLHVQLEQQNARLRAHQVHQMQEQEIAERIFRNLVHRGALQEPCFRYHVSPAALFNGDMLLAARTPDGGVRVLLGDFTGHGLPAAVGAIPVSEMFYAMTAKGCALRELTAEINRKLRAVLPPEIFFSACFVDVAADGASALLWNGGMPDVLVHGRDGMVRSYASTSLPLGAVPEPLLDLNPQALALHAGDRLYLYSDGVIEARNDEGVFFGDSRLRAVLAESGANGFEALRSAVERFGRHGMQHDDISLLEITPDAFAQCRA